MKGRLALGMGLTLVLLVQTASIARPAETLLVVDDATGNVPARASRLDFGNGWTSRQADTLDITASEAKGDEPSGKVGPICAPCLTLAPSLYLIQASGWEVGVAEDQGGSTVGAARP